MATRPDYYTVIHSFMANIDGVEQTYLAGDVVASGDPGLSASPDSFTPLVVRGAPPVAAPVATPVVEQATAAPGEKRGTPAKKG